MLPFDGYCLCGEKVTSQSREALMHWVENSVFQVRVQTCSILLHELLLHLTNIYRGGMVIGPLSMESA